jgi:hypothetical protein
LSKIQRNAGIDFFSTQEEQQRANRATEVVQEDIARAKGIASQIADRQAGQEALLDTPVEQIQENMVLPPSEAAPAPEMPDVRGTYVPARTGDPVGSETFVSDTPAMIDPNDLTVRSEMALTPETTARLESTPMQTYEQTGFFPSQQDSERFLEPAEKSGLGLDTITQESLKPRAILNDETAPLFSKAIDDMIRKDIGADDGLTTFSNLIEMSPKAFDFTDTKYNIFDKEIDTNNISPSELDTDPQGVIFRNLETVNFLLKSNQKLDLLENNLDPTSKIKPEAARAAMMAVLMTVSGKTRLLSSETDKPTDQQQYSGGLDRKILGPEVARLYERLLRPTKMDDPSEIFTGEVSGYGYNSRLTGDEQQVLGEVLLQGFVDANWNDLIQSRTEKSPDGKLRVVFGTTREGEKKLNSMRRAIRTQLGLSALRERPVSLVPSEDGKMIGEGAYTQRRDTKSPLKLANRTDIVTNGIRAVSNVAHTVVGHNAVLFAGFMGAAAVNKNNVFADMTKQSQTYFIKKRDELIKKYKDVSEKLGMSESDYAATLGSYTDARFNRIRPFQTFRQAAEQEAKRIQGDHLAERMETMLDGFNRVGNTAFYYNYTTINNSTRLMIANDELNYQSDKLARFLVAGAKPVVFNKTGTGARMALFNSLIAKLEKNARRKGRQGDEGFKKDERLTAEEGFIRVIARNVVLGADTMTTAEQVKALRDDLLGENPPRKYLKFGKELYDYTTQNANYLAAVKQAIANKQEPPKPRPFQIKNAEFEEFLNQHKENDTFYFAVDGLHELFRYATETTPGFATRVKAEVDGNSNGAVTQAYQMGQTNILERGGVLYAKVGAFFENLGGDAGVGPLTKAQAESLELDIREDVFFQMASLDAVHKNDGWNNIFKKIAGSPGKIKKLMKIPIMTSIYGKDPRFHSDTAAKFIQDNLDMFEDLMTSQNLSFDATKKQLAKFLEEGLITGLGGALEHAKLAKRMGRAHVFGNEIFVIEGANGAPIQAGGFQSIEKNPLPRMAARGMRNIFEFGPGTRKSTPLSKSRNLMEITLTETVPDPTAAKASKYVGETKFSVEEIGSKLMNQAAVNATQNIDATVAQLTTARQYRKRPDHLIMQVYDAFMGDALSFYEIERIANKTFDEVNLRYNMLEAEYIAYKNMIGRVKEKIATAKETGASFDIGTDGEYRGLGDFLRTDEQGKPRYLSIIARDMPPDTNPEDPNASKKRAQKLAGELQSLVSGFLPSDVNLEDKSVKLTPEQF